MERPRKRRRVPIVVEQRVRRPIDKNLVNVLVAAQANVQTNISLITATFPATITGVRWSISYINNVGGTQQSLGWVIVRVKDGLAPNTMSFTNAATLCEPEQEVIAFGRISLSDGDTGNGPAAFMDSGSTKSMRKLMGGDQIYFCVNGTAAGPTVITGTIQFFSKT